MTAASSPEDSGTDYRCRIVPFNDEWLVICHQTNGTLAIGPLSTEEAALEARAAHTRECHMTLGQYR